MAGILWLASYPKSGNTWLRIFLANLFADARKAFDINALGRHVYGEMSADLYERVAGRLVAGMTDEELHRLRPKVHRLLAGLRPETVFVKTHNAIAVQDGVATVTPEVTAGAIYIVRNPLDVVVSYADHYGLTLDQAVEAIASPENRVVTSEKAVFQHLGDWSGHVRSWTEAPGLAPHVVRYEDLLDDPQAGFAGVVRFLGLDAPRPRLRRAIRFAGFDEVKRQERRRGFTEKSRNSSAFFRQGQAGQWREALTPKQIDAVTRAHSAAMERYGYLP
ncbi:MAG: sulfotransferase domain-containing protein [Alphaproteobacteria bacterium]|jgi:hypothetical protein|nr:sulfotransferase domain-containing protein [Alphaproteobacteria bacterium]